MSMMESPLEVLSRAATMVQDNANDSRLTTKELPTTKWRRDRRLRTSEYHHSLSTSSSPSSPQSQQQHHSPQQQQQQQYQQQSQYHHHHLHHYSPNGNLNSHSNNSVRPLSETTQNSIVECPLDMTVASVKPRTPPPPYREPLPGSTFITALARPSVITQAPPKRDSSCNRDENLKISNCENDDTASETNSVCDPVIDEHFRRSLGADYMTLFKKKSPPTTPKEREPSVEPPDSDERGDSPKHRTTVTVNGESVSTSVDDHFAKALGDTWRKLQAGKSRNEE